MMLPVAYKRMRNAKQIAIPTPFMAFSTKASSVAIVGHSGHVYLIEDPLDLLLILFHLVFDLFQLSLHPGDSGFRFIIKIRQLSTDGFNSFTRFVKDGDELHFDFFSLHFVGVAVFFTEHTGFFFWSD